MSSRHLTRQLAVLGAAIALATHVNAAEAQIGGLLKKAAKAAAAKALEKPAEKIGDAAAASGVVPQEPRSLSDSLYDVVHPSGDDVVPITGDLLARFFKGYEKERLLVKQAEECAQRVEQSSEGVALSRQRASPMTDEHRVDLENRIQGLLVKQCGATAASGDAARFAAQIEAAKLGGMQPRQYAMIRERVLGFAALAHKYETRNYSGYKFGAAERQALQTHLDQATQLLEDYTGESFRKSR